MHLMERIASMMSGVAGMLPFWHSFSKSKGRKADPYQRHYNKATKRTKGVRHRRKAVARRRARNKMVRQSRRINRMRMAA